MKKYYIIYFGDNDNYSYKTSNEFKVITNIRVHSRSNMVTFKVVYTTKLNEYGSYWMNLNNFNNFATELSKEDTFLYSL